MARHTSPGGRPQPITFHGEKLWLGSWDTMRLYEIDPDAWTVSQEIQLPGIPYGLTSFGGSLRVVVSANGDADDRYIYNVTPGRPVSKDGRVACPELTGSHLTTDGTSLYLMQQTLQKMVELAPDATVKREIPFATRCAGFGFSGKSFYYIAADAEFDVLELATRDLATPAASPTILAPMDVDARGLAFDGLNWWTAIREKGEVISFSA